MAGWIDRLMGGKEKSVDHAKERLKLVLIHDRTDLTPQALVAMKNELIEVISRYIDIDPDAVHIDVAQEGREQRLIADIPLMPKQPSSRRR